ncbi:hypothetical protein NE237_032765 [Protea cynaroides]|uniref:F-box domain-containing protein n=1 Tax=Protea cynaroides TaxID=273540 RepID=A0A9Q0R3D8_9MAGN|nr:hypothetical protein NE237_032765 [Protea cynaroides]
MADHLKTENELERDWANLNLDLLIIIFQKLDFEDLVIGVTLVCHSWFEGSKNPHCWQTLDLHNWSRIVRRFHPNENKDLHLELRPLIELAIRYSGGSIHSIIYPDLCVRESDFLLVAERCPNLKFFYLRLPHMISIPGFCAAISKWKDLEGMDVDKYALHDKILKQINKSCASFTHLRAYPKVYAANAYDIVRCLPKLKSLDLSQSLFSYDSLMYILRGCKELESLDISGCGSEIGDDDTDVHVAAAHLKIFRYDPGPFTYWFCPKCMDEDFFRYAF